MFFNNKKRALSDNESYAGDKICTKLNFAAREAYKILRTNLFFSFADDEKCHVIGVTSSLRGEGKSTTSSNLSYTIAQANKRVLLIDADMRLPNMHKLLGCTQSPGLSNLLAGINSAQNPVRNSGILDTLSLITAGDIPPNPTELLSSNRMETLLNLLKTKFDYIIIDLPPLDMISDALIVSGYADGMVMVVRQNYVDRKALDNSIQQLKFHNVNILGFVWNFSEIKGGYYNKKSYYNKSYERESDEQNTEVNV